MSLARLVGLICRRWRVEEDFAVAKGVAALDSGQVITWVSWQRWSTASLVALMVLAVGAALERVGPETELVPVSVFELVRLLRVLVLPASMREPAHVLAWSAWRRRHQYADTAP
nr:hypothetical protein [Mangrovactinospora gilvigrisea]